MFFSSFPLAGDSPPQAAISSQSVPKAAQHTCFPSCCSRLKGTRKTAMCLKARREASFPQLPAGVLTALRGQAERPGPPKRVAEPPPTPSQDLPTSCWPPHVTISNPTSLSLSLGFHDTESNMEDTAFAPREINVEYGSGWSPAHSHPPGGHQAEPLTWKLCSWEVSHYPIHWKS